MNRAKVISESATLEKRRVRAARITILLALVALAILALWQCAESSLEESNLSDFAAILNLSAGEGTDAPKYELGSNTEVQGARQSADPLALEQEGINFMDMNTGGNILWYQSIWDVSQSRVLLERALIFQGWQSMGEEGDTLMSFVYAPSEIAGGSSLLASFYPLDEGCSILIELL